MDLFLQQPYLVLSLKEQNKEQDVISSIVIVTQMLYFSQANKAANNQIEYSMVHNSLVAKYVHETIFEQIH